MIVCKDFQATLCLDEYLNVLMEKKMTDRLRWGILGTGRISSLFAEALNNIPDKAELLAVASRGKATGKIFGDIYQIPRIYEGYQDLVDDPEVDVVYIGTPGIFHYRDMMMCLEAGKNILCEKSFTINARQAKEVIDLARKKLSGTPLAVWVLVICVVPVLGSLAYWIIKPTAESNV
jgi:predicted dehydrogenase